MAGSLVKQVCLNLSRNPKPGISQLEVYPSLKLSLKSSYPEWIK